jgi:hypothetical protein
MIENSTLSGNTVPTGSGDRGGAVYDFSQPTSALTIESSTIAGNTAGDRGGGLYQYYGTTVRNTLIADNSATTGPDLFGPNDPPPGLPANVAFSLIEQSGSAFNSTGPNVLGLDPQLGPLASNGGPTQTRVLAATSPAIDKGLSSLTSDQRGVLRPIDFPGISNAAGGNGADVGAFELQPDNNIKLGKLKRNKTKGTGKQVVLVPLPDAGKLTISGKGLKTKKVQVADTGKVKLPVIPKGKARKTENATGKAKVKAKITYSPIGNATMTLKAKLKLLKQ